MRRPPYLGIFWASLGLMFLEVLATRVIAFVVNSNDVAITVSLAMMGIGVAGSWLCLRPAAAERARPLAALLCAGASLATVALFVTATMLKTSGNRQLDQEAPFWIFVQTTISQASWHNLVIGAVMAVSYGLYGAAIAVVFREVNRGDLHRLYAVDLAGACLGALLAVALLEGTGFFAPLVFAATVPLAAAASFVFDASRRSAAAYLGAALVLGCGLCTAAAQRLTEPPPHLPSLARTRTQYTDAGKPTELWHTWTSYGRVAAVDLPQAGGEHVTLMVHGNGVGHAEVVDYRKPTGSMWLGRVATAACRPDRILVLMAGAGKDMVILHRLLSDRAVDITGVELVPQVITWPLSRVENGLAELLSRPDRRLVAAEAREFLARDRTRYDSIIVSWWGHSMAYFSGMSANSAGYVYSREGLAALVDHLSDGGQLTILNGNKVKVILALREVLAERGVRDAADAFVVLGNEEETRDWAGPSPQTRLLVKPRGFSVEDLAAIRAAGAGDARFEVQYAGGIEETPLHAPYVIAATASEPEAALRKRLPRETEISVPTDDRPYVESILPRFAFLEPWFWTQPAEADRVQRNQRSLWKRNLVFALSLSFVSAVLILGPLVLARRRIGREAGALNQLTYFACLGAGFMLVEMGLIQKLRLVVGHPGHTIAIVLSSIVLFTGAGSLISTWTFARGLGFRSAALIAAAAVLGTVLLLDAAGPWIVGLPRALKLAVCFLVPALPAICLGQMFPRGLAAIPGEHGMLVPWAFAVNATAGTVASALASPISYMIGFRATIFAGAAFYLVVAALPHAVRTPRAPGGSSRE